MKCIMMTIPGNTDRQAHFASVYPSRMPAYETFVGVDADSVVIPDWWEGTAGMASCLANFLAVLHTIDEITYFFEDDCTFSPSFFEDITSVADMPEHDIFNMCPSHISSSVYTPELICPNALKIKCCACTSAMIITPRGAERLIQLLSETHWKCRHVPDQQIALGMLRGDLTVYGSFVPLCGQMGGVSTANPDNVWPMNWTPPGFEYIDLEGNRQYAERIEIVEDPQ